MRLCLSLCRDPHPHRLPSVIGLCFKGWCEFGGERHTISSITVSPGVPQPGRYISPGGELGFRDQTPLICLIGILPGRKDLFGLLCHHPTLTKLLGRIDYRSNVPHRHSAFFMSGPCEAVFDLLAILWQSEVVREQGWLIHTHGRNFIIICKNEPFSHFP